MKENVERGTKGILPKCFVTTDMKPRGDVKKGE